MRQEGPIISEDDDTHVVSFQVKGHSPNPRSELNHLSGLHLVESNHSRNTVTNAQHCTELSDIFLSQTKDTNGATFKIFCSMTLAVSAIPSFREKPPRDSRSKLCIIVLRNKSKPKYHNKHSNTRKTTPPMAPIKYQESTTTHQSGRETRKNTFQDCG